MQKMQNSESIQNIIDSFHSGKNQTAKNSAPVYNYAEVKYFGSENVIWRTHWTSY